MSYSSTTREPHQNTYNLRYSFKTLDSWPGPQIVIRAIFILLYRFLNSVSLLSSFFCLTTSFSHRCQLFNASRPCCCSLRRLFNPRRKLKGEGRARKDYYKVCMQKSGFPSWARINGRMGAHPFEKASNYKWRRGLLMPGTAVPQPHTEKGALRTKLLKFGGISF